MLGRCDDSSGRIGDIFGDAIRQLGPMAKAARPEPKALAEQVLDAFTGNGYWGFDVVIQQLAVQPVPVPHGLCSPGFAHQGDRKEMPRWGICRSTIA